MWIHGPQPFAFEGIETLAQFWERRPGSVPLYSFEAVPGANRVLEKFDGMPEVRSVERRGTVQQDLERLLHEWGRESSETVLVRERVPVGKSDAVAGKRTSAHLARLWAAGEVLRLLESRNATDREQATKLAMRYQIVTPVSGAVVLETQEQYNQAGLQPASPATVPSIPEPEEWLLMFVVAAMLLWVWRMRRPAWVRA
jgi:hypothetical protein